jgi:hypothetical protein
VYGSRAHCLRFLVAAFLVAAIDETKTVFSLVMHQQEDRTNCLGLEVRSPISYNEIRPPGVRPPFGLGRGTCYEYRSGSFHLNWSSISRQQHYCQQGIGRGRYVIPLAFPPTCPLTFALTWC